MTPHPQPLHPANRSHPTSTASKRHSPSRPPKRSPPHPSATTIHTVDGLPHPARAARLRPRHRRHPPARSPVDALSGQCGRLRPRPPHVRRAQAQEPPPSATSTFAPTRLAGTFKPLRRASNLLVHGSFTLLGNADNSRRPHEVRRPATRTPTLSAPSPSPSPVGPQRPQHVHVPRQRGTGSTSPSPGPSTTSLPSPAPLINLYQSCLKT